MTIKNIIFDLGGVILDLDFERMAQQFYKMGIQDFEDYFTLKKQVDFFEDLELGQITPAEFCERLRKESKVDIDNVSIENAWNLILSDFSLERMNFLENISSKYKLFLFSNTNIIHAKCFEKRCFEQTGKTLDSYFDQVFYSHGLHLRKPNVVAFEKVLEHSGLQASETLFIDDNAANIAAAQKAGIQTIHLQKPQTILDLGLEQEQTYR